MMIHQSLLPSSRVSHLPPACPFWLSHSLSAILILIFPSSPLLPILPSLPPPLPACSSPYHLPSLPPSLLPSLSRSERLRLEQDEERMVVLHVRSPGAVFNGTLVLLFLAACYLTYR